MLGCYQAMIPDGGFFLNTRQEMIAGEELLLEIELPQLGHSYRMECVVLGSPRDMGLQTEAGYLLGFKPAAKETRDKLMEAIGWHIIGSNRRYHPRFPAAVAVAWRQGSSEEMHVDHTENLSLGGAFVRTKEIPPKDSILTLHLRTGGRKAPVTLVGRVAWTRPSGDDTGMGIHFLDMDAHKGLQLRSVLDGE
jgi:type IV pilus assembly protein PilZ